MILRVLTDNQYRLADDLAPEVEHLDTELLAALNADDDAAYQTALQQLIAYVRERGTLVPHEELTPSDVIVPAPDMSLAETKDLLAKAELRMPTE